MKTIPNTKKISGSEMSATEPIENANTEKEADHHPYRRPKDAATLILVDRSAKTPKVLVGRRHDKVVFMQPQDRPVPRALVDHRRDPRGS
jgi:hypothetical protein